MGKARGAGEPGGSNRGKLGWRGDDARSQSNLRALVEGGKRSRFKPQFEAPSAGERFGALTVLGEEPGKRDRQIRVQCDCGAPPHLVAFSNLRKGASTRCGVCARNAAASSRSKRYWGYADIVVEEGHRRRLLNRISAVLTRTNPNNASQPRHANYGGRGVTTWPAWREGVAGRRAFLAYLVTLEGWDQMALELDRIEVNGPYAPGNLRFVTKAANNQNKRTVGALQTRIAYLEERLRHCQCGAAQSVHHTHE